MKKLLPLLLLMGCTTLKYIPSESLYYGLDFRRYAEEEFLITAESYSGKFMTLGMVNYEIYPEANYVQTGGYSGSYSQGGYTGVSKWVTGIILPEWAVDSMFIKCKSLGANALVNFKIESVSKNYTNVTNPISLTGIKISGYAIKRLE